MSTFVGMVDKHQVRQLILAAKHDSLSEYEQKTLSECLSYTSSLWVGMVGNVFVCAWGLIPPTLMSTHAYLWLYCTEKVDDYKFLFVRHSQRAIEDMLKLYPMITGHCEMGNDRAIRWVKWLGGTFGDYDGKLVPFTIVRR